MNDMNKMSKHTEMIMDIDLAMKVNVCNYSKTQHYLCNKIKTPNHKGEPH